MTWPNVWELCRAIYSIGLLLIGLALLRAIPPALSVLRGLTAALTVAATSLRTAAADSEALERIDERTARIEALLRGRRDD